MAKRMADAVWEGGLRGGRGRMKLGGGAYEGPYTFSSRFEEGAGTNPEELIAAAHAGCFSMALSGELESAGFTAQRIATRAQVYLEKVADKWTITRIELVTEAKVPGIDEHTFLAKAEEAKRGCPVSRLLAAAKITLQAKLV
jgi:osmotically inducible protein OsmC